MNDIARRFLIACLNDWVIASTPTVFRYQRSVAAIIRFLFFAQLVWTITLNDSRHTCGINSLPGWRLEFGSQPARNNPLHYCNDNNNEILMMEWIIIIKFWSVLRHYILTKFLISVIIETRSRNKDIDQWERLTCEAQHLIPCTDGRPSSITRCDMKDPHHGIITRTIPSHPSLLITFYNDLTSL